MQSMNLRCFFSFKYRVSMFSYGVLYHRGTQFTMRNLTVDREKLSSSAPCVRGDGLTGDQALD
jgi:hypothetical protein